MKPFPHVLIRASAGTGKTFELSNRYLGLVAAGAPADQILATTFTRKAAGEILDRVLVRLAEAALDHETCGKLGESIRDERLTPPRARGLLGELVHHVYRLRVSTLDAFFAKIAASCALELGLPPGWRIVEESADDRLRGEAIRAVLAGEDTRSVVALMHLLTKGEARRKVSDQIRDLVDELYGAYLETPAEAWRRLPRPQPLSLAELEAALGELERAALPSDSRFTKARNSDLDLAKAGRWDEFIGAGLAGKIADGDDTYYRKEIAPELVAVYEKLLKHARAVLLRQLADQTETTHKLLEKFDDHYQRLKLARRALRFDDVTRKLHAVRSAVDMERLAYRLDARIAHLLLDEFQDTSLAQWNVLRPFAAELIGNASGRDSFFCVGDVKQAIYGWRGGVPELFDAIRRDWPAVAPRTLNKSFRSTQPVIDAVNRVFGSLERNQALVEYPAATADWARGFEPHTTVHEDLPGYVRLVVAPRGEAEDDDKEATLAFAAEEIQQLAAQSPGCTIGALVRDNKAVARLIYELRRRDVDASEEGGNPLTDSPAVTLVLSLLTLGDHPGDTVARFHVAHSALGPAVGLTDHADESQAERVSLAVRRTLVNEGYGPSVYRWARELTAACGPRDANRLWQLVELAYRYEADATLRSRDFLAFVEKLRVEDPTAAPVRVMTIHQAKGLQFDIVVLPQLDAKLVGQPPPIIVGRPEPTEPAQIVCRYANQHLQQLLPAELRRAFDYRTQRVACESLSLLYVALTRAARALHVILCPPAENEKKLPATFAGVLRAALAEEKPIEPGGELFAAGDADWWQRDERSGRKTPAQEAPKRLGGPGEFVVALAPHGKRRQRGLERQSPSGLEGGARVELSKLLRLDAAPALARGTVFHAWFEQIEWLDDGEPNDEALRRAARDEGATEADLTAWLPQFRAMLAAPPIRAALLREQYLDLAQAPWSADAELRAELAREPFALEVQRERSFAIREHDTILSGALDRVVLIRRGGRVAAAEVLDFKTDQVAADDPQALSAVVANYRPQLEAYRRAIARLHHVPPSRIFARLLLVGAGRAERT